MSKRAFVFPGQGAQEVGMGRALAESHAEAMAVWTEAESALGMPVRDIAWEGTAEALARTDVTQPALLTAEIAALRAVEAAGYAPTAVAGHSLGEYAALVAAGSLAFGDAVRIVRTRGEAMQAAAQTAGGGMAAVIGGDEDALERLCAAIGGVAPANLNAPGQVVVSGTEEALAVLAGRVKEAGARRFVRLNVAGAFHSPAMAPAAEAVARALSGVTVSNAAVPVYANVTAEPVTSSEALQRGLVAQVCGQVRWSASVRRMAEDGVTHYVELGPGNVLAGLIKRIQPEAIVHSVGDPDSLATFLEAAEA